MSELLRQGLTAESLSDNRLGRVLDSLFASGLNRVFGTLAALKALEVYAIPVPWVHQDTTTIAFHGVYALRVAGSAFDQDLLQCLLCIHLKHRRASMATWIRAA